MNRSTQINDRVIIIMTKKLLMLWLLVVIALINCVESFRYEGAGEPDFIKDAYLKMEMSLYDKYVDKDSKSITQNDRLYKVFNQHHMFIKQYLNTTYNPRDFTVLSRFYEWNTIENDINGIHHLFEAFRQHLETVLTENGGGFDERASLDFIETTLEDPQWPVNETLQKIKTIVMDQGLYYKAISVLKIQIQTN